MLAGLRFGEAVQDPLPRGLDELRGVVLGHEAFGHDVRTGDDRAGPLLDGHDDEEDAVAADRPAIAHDRLTHVANAQAVDVDDAGLNLLAHVRAVFVDLEDVPVRQHERVLRFDA